MLFAGVASALALAVFALAFTRFRAHNRARFFAAVFGGLAAGAWIFAWTRVPAFVIAPPIILALYLRPLRAIRYVSAGLGGVGLGILLGELWAMFFHGG